MPFTFAHPAIVLPLHRVHRLSFTALVLGSMSPDFEYFLRLKPYSTLSHTMAGLLLFDLPVVIALAFLFHHLVKRPMILHLPSPFDRGLFPYAEASWRPVSVRSVLVFGYSALIGSFSHIAWDSFTHEGAPMVMRIALLQQRLVLGEWSIPVYKCLQHLSSMGGLLLIALFVWFAARKALAAGMSGGGGDAFPRLAQTVSLRAKLLFWTGVASSGLVTSVLYLTAAFGARLYMYPLQGIVPFLSGGMLGLLLMSLLAKARFIRNKTE